MDTILANLISLFGVFSNLWEVIYAEAGEGKAVVHLDSTICVVGFLLALLNFPLVPLDGPLPAKIAGWAQRIMIAGVGFGLFQVFAGHFTGAYPTVRPVELYIHGMATASLISGTILRSLTHPKWRRARPSAMR